MTYKHLTSSKKALWEAVQKQAMQEVPNSIRGQVSVSNYKMKTTFREVIYFFKAGLDSAREDQDCLPFKRQEENQEQEEVRFYKHQYKDHGTEIHLPL